MTEIILYDTDIPRIVKYAKMISIDGYIKAKEANNNLLINLEEPINEEDKPLMFYLKSNTNSDKLSNMEKKSFFVISE